MKRYLFTTVAAILCAGLLFSSCGKDDVIHDDGDSGAITSLYTIEPGQWKSEGNGIYSNDNNTLDELTENITDQGAVLIFLADQSTESDALIYASAPKLGVPDISGDFSYDFQADATDGSVLVSATGYPASATRPDFPVYVKVVSIPSALLEAHPNVNMKDYNSVKRAFNIK